MKLHYIKRIGYIATFLTIISFMPQVYKMYLTNHTFGLSLSTFILIFLYSFFWLLYGIHTDDIPLIVSQFFVIIFSTYLIYKILINNISIDKEENKFIKNYEYIKSLKWI